MLLLFLCAFHRLQVVRYILSVKLKIVDRISDINSDLLFYANKLFGKVVSIKTYLNLPT